MPHLPGKDLRSCPHAAPTITGLHAFVLGLICRVREQGTSEGLPDPATQADADVASTAINSTDVVEARRMESSVRRSSRQKVTVIRKSRVRIL